MERLNFQTNLIITVCVYISYVKQVQPIRVMELMYDDRYGFSAEAFVDDTTSVNPIAN